MENYLLFILIAMITVISPGPGVILTLTNTIRFGVSGAAGGIFGIASGTFIVAGLSATSLGALLVTSAVAFNVMKYIGAVYLLYLGVKLWRATPVELDLTSTVKVKSNRQFIQGLMLQLTNPKAVFFFLSIFPQFVDLTNIHNNYQFLLLVVTYSCLVIVIHFAYACIAKKAGTWITTEKASRGVNRLGAGTFMCFGIGLVVVNKA